MAVIVIEMFDIDGFSGDKTGAFNPLCHPLSVDTFLQQQQQQQQHTMNICIYLYLYIYICLI